jgi:hypothetical protein
MNCDFKCHHIKYGSFWRLLFARLRLTRWGEPVNIYDDPRLGRPDATAAEIQVAKDILLQTLVLLTHIILRTAHTLSLQTIGVIFVYL